MKLTLSSQEFAMTTTCGATNDDNVDIMTTPGFQLLHTYYIDGLAQDCSNSRALTMKLLQPCTKPSIYDIMVLIRLGYHKQLKSLSDAHMMCFNKVIHHWFQIMASCLFGTKPYSQSVLVNCELNLGNLLWLNWNKNSTIFFLKWIRICCLHNNSHFVWLFCRLIAPVIGVINTPIFASISSLVLGQWHDQ